MNMFMCIFTCFFFFAGCGQKMAALNKFCFVSPWAAGLSHICDAQLVFWYSCCSTDVDLPPSASWPTIKEPALPSALCHTGHVCVFVCAYSISTTSG